METKTKEFVWNAKLSKDKKIAKWSGRQDGALEQIVLKLAVLGAGAQKNERNLVQVTSFDSEQNKVNTVICALTLECRENQQLADLSLFPPANFTLIEGSGPVHIVANHIVYDDEEELSDDEDLSDSEVEAEMVDLREKLKARKGKGDAAGTSKKMQQKGKKEEDDSDEEDLEMDDDFEDADEEDDEEEEEEEEEPQPKQKTPKAQKQGTPQKKTPVPVEIVDDDDDDDDAEEDEEEEAPAKKRKLTNGKSATPAQEIKSPERTPKKPTEQKTPKNQNNSTPKTPKSEKKTPGKTQYTSVDQVKAAILKYPGGKPRKEDKFCNWVKNMFKVAEPTWVSDLWKWHKKEIGL